jgi:hypothetical protein
VSSIDSVALSNGHSVNRYVESASKYWIYGIGSSRGLIELGADDEKLLCYDNPGFFYHVNYTDSIMPGELQRNCFDIQSLRSLGIKDHPDKDIAQRVFPNPWTGDDLHVVISEAYEPRAIVITDPGGKTMLTFSKVHSGDNVLHVPLPPGVYCMRIEGAGLCSIVRLIRL